MIIVEVHGVPLEGSDWTNYGAGFAMLPLYPSPWGLFITSISGSTLGGEQGVRIGRAARPYYVIPLRFAGFFATLWVNG